MKRALSLSLMVVFFVMGCSSEALRPAGKPYPGYSCRESLMHFYSYCSKEKLTKEEFESKVEYCEKQLATKICDKEQAGLLWCMGRVAPGQYSSGGGYVYAAKHGFYFDNTLTIDGCDCGVWEGALRKCRLEKGMFDTYDKTIVPLKKE